MRASQKPDPKFRTCNYVKRISSGRKQNDCNLRLKAFSKNIAQVHSFLRLCDYYCRFVKNFAATTAPFSDLAEKKNSFKWTALQQKSHKQLKDRPLSSPVFRCADSFLPYELSAHAYGLGVEAVLTQTDKLGTRPVALFFRTLNGAEQGLSTHER